MAGPVSFYVTHKSKAGKKHRYQNYVFLGGMHSSRVSTGRLHGDNNPSLSYITAYSSTREDDLNVSSFLFSNTNSVNAVDNEYLSRNNNEARLNAQFL